VKHTPDNIEKLEPNQVFVFGSNLAGRHGAGAARVALEKFGAKYGIGEGLQGQSYAFPTLDSYFRKVPVLTLKMAVYNLYQTCHLNPDKEFLLTKVGCGIAGFDEDYMKSLFYEPRPANLIFPEGW